VTVNEYAKIAKEYYNSDAHEIYKECWGGENHHLGLFDDTDDFSQAAQQANENLLGKLQIKENDLVLDIGSGFCGLPRYIASNTKCGKIIALNISEKENDYAKQKNIDEGLGHKIDVIEGDFNDMPFNDQEFDIIVSQDSMLHSPDKQQVLKECSRVLKPGGNLVFSDILKQPTLSKQEAEIVYQRVNIPHLASREFYKEALLNSNFEIIEEQDLGSNNLGKSYQAVFQNLNQKKEYLMTRKQVPKEKINKTLEGLNYWVEKAFEGKIGWGLFVAQRNQSY